jgi:hypothetical protein
MTSNPSASLTEEDLPKIRAVARDSAVHSPAQSLAAWGVINIGAWWFLAVDSRGLLTHIDNPGTDLYLLIYAPMIIGGEGRHHDPRTARIDLGAVHRTTAG